MARKFLTPVGLPSGATLPAVVGPAGSLFYKSDESTVYASDGTTWNAVSGSGGTGHGIPTGGTTGQILAKNSGTNYDAVWSSVAPSAGYTSVVKHQVKALEAIEKGQAVYVGSANGSNMLVRKASNGAELTSSKTMGLLDATVAINDFANVITEGLLDGLDTSVASAGDPVWLGTDGYLIYGITNKPVAPAHLVFIGIVTRAHATQGQIFVRPQNGFEINELHDVVFSTLTDGDALIWNGATGLWTNTAVVGQPGPEGPPGSPGSNGDMGPEGPVGLIWLGEYNSATEYVRTNAVSYEGSAWYATATSTGSTPSSSPLVWSLLSSKGADSTVAGPAGADGAPGADGAAGADGPSGVISVTAPITNSGTSTAANLGITVGSTGGVQAWDADLDAISALTGTGFIKNNGEYWYMDDSTYLTQEADTLETITARGSSSTSGILVTNTTEATSVITGAVVTSGGLGVAKNAYVGGNLVISGDFTVNGTSTTVHTSELAVDDPLIYVGVGNTANSVDIGIVGHFDNGTYQHTGFVRDASDGKWKLFSGVTTEPTTIIDFTGATYDTLKLGTVEGALSGNATTATTLQTARTINGTSFDGSSNITVTAAAGTLTGTTLNSTVVSSSLTSVGTVTSGTWSGSFGNTNISNLAGTSSWTTDTTAPTATTRLNYEGYLYATKIYNAVYNDYAEYFKKDDQTLEPGDVVCANPNGDGFIKSTTANNPLVIGVYSDDYAHCIGGLGDGNDEETHASVGLAGRVRVKAVGNIKKGDLLVSSNIPGVATVGNATGCIIGKALEDHSGNEISRIKMLVMNG